MKRNKNFFNLEEKDNSEIFWNIVLIKPFGDSGVRIKNIELDVTPSFQKLLTNTNVTTKCVDNFEKEIIYDMLNSVRFSDNLPTKA